MNTSEFLHDDFAFGATIVVPRKREVLHKGVKVDIGDRAFDLLLFLVESRGSVLSKDSIIAEVWRNRVVEDNTVEGQISALRRALGEDRSNIRTVTGRGYQFTGELLGATRYDELPVAQTEKHAFSGAISGVSLPAEISPIIGRENAVQDIGAALQKHRLVTLVGSGGVGKTRLAIEAARQAMPHFHGGVCLAELAANTSGEHLATTIAVALGYPPGDGTPSLERLAPTLLSRDLLLVLDNCEHLIDEAARMAERLLQIAPQATVLATSREPLRIPGECVYRVPSLEVPPEDECETAREYGAVQLFEERAGLSIQHDRDAAAMLRLESRICRQLDGIPLALELAAACVPMLGLQGTAERLADRFQILTRGARTALPRQQTLRATLDWSYSLLSETQQTVFKRLSLFAGSFTLESAQGMVGCSSLSPDALVSTVIELVDKSLVSVISDASGMRYRLLESTREYGREMLREEGRLGEWSRRHASYYLDIFSIAEQRASAREDVDWERDYVPHLNDLRAAMQWSFGAEGDMKLAVELTVAGIPFLMHLALLQECLAKVDRALEWLSSEGGPADERHMKLYAARGMSLLCHTVASHTSDAFESTVEIAARIGNPGFQLLGLWGRWMCHYLSGEFESAIPLSRRIYDFASTSPYQCDRLAAHRLLGMSHLFSGELAGAVEQLRLASDDRVQLTPAQRMRFLYDEKMLAHASLALGLWFMGKTGQARQVAHQSLEDARGLDHPVSICYALSEGVCTLALLCGDEQELEQAVVSLTAETRRHSISTWRARAQMWQGLLQLRAGNANAYDELIGPAMANIGSKRYYLSLTPYVTAVAESLATHGKHEQAAEIIDSSLARAMRTGDKCSLPELLRAKADILVASEDQRAMRVAEAILLDAMQRAEQYRLLSWQLRCAVSLARLTHIKGQYDAALAIIHPMVLQFAETQESADVRAAHALMSSLNRRWSNRMSRAPKH
jgi:predicted ATPase/DNA-binding winged helix-turn-helix (wHTH) protein